MFPYINTAQVMRVFGRCATFKSINLRNAASAPHDAVGPIYSLKSKTSLVLHWYHFLKANCHDVIQLVLLTERVCHSASYPKCSCSADERTGCCLGQRASVMARSSPSGRVGRRRRKTSRRTSADVRLCFTSWDANMRSWGKKEQHAETITPVSTGTGRWKCVLINKCVL